MTLVNTNIYCIVPVQWIISCIKGLSFHSQLLSKDFLLIPSLLIPYILCVYSLHRVWS